LYDERFLNQGGDKQEHAVLLNAEGFRFFVVRDHFIYHLDHFSSFKWPGGELRSGSLQDVFNIYSHFHPETEAKFGMGYRNPRCKVRAHSLLLFLLLSSFFLSFLITCGSFGWLFYLNEMDYRKRGFLRAKETEVLPAPRGIQRGSFFSLFSFFFLLSF